MKIGTTVLLLVIILIAFGYVLSDTQQAHAKLSEVSKELDAMKSQNVQMTEQLSSCREADQKNRDLIAQYEHDLETLRNQNSTQAGIITSLEEETAKLRTENQKPQPGTTNALLGMNPVILAAILGIQLVMFLVQNKHKLSIARSRKNEYVRLSAEERALIVNLRRTKQGKPS